MRFKQALNDAARTGPGGNGRKRAAKFAQKPYRMGEARELCSDKALATADAIDDEEIGRKVTCADDASGREPIDSLK